MRLYLGRQVFGLAAVGFGVFALVWHDFNIWQQIRALGNVPHREILLYIVAAVEIFGGVAIQGRRTALAGAIALGAIYLVFALLWVPLIIEKPLVFDRWGNFFEQFSLVSGALIVYASFDCAIRRARPKWRGSGISRLEFVWFHSRSNSSFIFLEPPISFPSGFLWGKCSGR